MPARELVELAIRAVVHQIVSTQFRDGATCTAVTVSNVQLDGVALDPAAIYFVTANSFLADGGDNFATFATVAGVAGAAGALCVILALKSGGTPLYVAPLVFAGAPIACGYFMISIDDIDTRMSASSSST